MKHQNSQKNRLVFSCALCALFMSALLIFASGMIGVAEALASPETLTFNANKLYHSNIKSRSIVQEDKTQAAEAQRLNPISSEVLVLQDRECSKSMSIDGTQRRLTGKKMYVNIINGNEKDNNIKGQECDDVISGASGQDWIEGGDGSDTINGNGGDDRIEGGDGGDTIMGNGGDDRIFGDKGSDTINGNGGDDRIFGDEALDTINGNGGNDRIFGGDGPDILAGDAGDDLIKGDAGNDIISGNGGNDILWGNVGNDTLDGGDGEDKFYLANDEICDEAMGNTCQDNIANYNPNQDALRYICAPEGDCPPNTQERFVSKALFKSHAEFKTPHEQVINDFPVDFIFDPSTGNLFSNFGDKQQETPRLIAILPIGLETQDIQIEFMDISLSTQAEQDDLFTVSAESLDTLLYPATVVDIEEFDFDFQPNYLDETPVNEKNTFKEKY